MKLLLEMKKASFVPTQKELGNVMQMCQRFDVPVVGYLKNLFPELYEKATRKIPGKDYSKNNGKNEKNEKNQAHGKRFNKRENQFNGHGKKTFAEQR
jgi:hypothetical protein